MDGWSIPVCTHLTEIQPCIDTYMLNIWNIKFVTNSRAKKELNDLYLGVFCNTETAVVFGMQPWKTAAYVYYIGYMIIHLLCAGKSTFPECFNYLTSPPIHVYISIWKVRLEASSLGKVRCWADWKLRDITLKWGNLKSSAGNRLWR